MRTVIMILILISPFTGLTQNYRYYKAQMHCHSTNSDGNMDSLTVLEEYKDRGYEILFLTDHNYMSQMQAHSQPGLLCINSEELTFDKHMNGFFMTHTVDASGFTPQQAIDSVKAQGGLIQFNHPIKTLMGDDWSYNASQFLALHDLDMIEIHNWGTEFTLSPFNKLVWDSVLTAGCRIWGTATDDMHKLSEVLIPTIDRAWVMIWLSELHPDSVFRALQEGHFYSSTGVIIQSYDVRGDTLSLICSECDEISFIGDHGDVKKTVEGQSAQYIRDNETYIRVQIEGSTGLFGTETTYAFTQPHFFEDDHSGISLKETSGCMLMGNPAEGSAHLFLTLENPGQLLINLYDIKGQFQRSICRDQISAGEYLLSFPVGDLTPGLYLLSISHEGLQQTLKLIVR
jgi:5-hydroxyisourate hydrolase-like protein (transthyretin family)